MFLCCVRSVSYVALQGAPRTAGVLSPASIGVDMMRKGDRTSQGSVPRLQTSRTMQAFTELFFLVDQYANMRSPR